MNSEKLLRSLSIGGKWIAALAVAALAGCVVEPAHVYYRPAVVYAPPPRPVVVYQPPVYQPGVVVAPGAVVEQPAPDAQPAAPADTQIEQLVAPIALYPDPLLAVVLPASTFPQQVQEAGSWLASNPSPPQEAIDAQQWEPSVKALVRYPDALQALNKDPQWTESLGSAFNSDPKGVSDAIQELRSRAVAANNLQTNAQVAVVQENNVIAIQPAQPNVIYVPTYDPVVVYASPYPIVYASYYPVGPWLVNGYDWGGGVIFVGDWRGPYYWEGGRWGYHYGWVGHYSYWHRDGRWGPVYRGRYYAPRAFHGRGPEFQRAMARPNPYHGNGRSVAQIQHHEVQRTQQVHAAQQHQQLQHQQQQHPQQHPQGQGGGAHGEEHHHD